jgi:hypothetical protein
MGAAGATYKKKLVSICILMRGRKTLVPPPVKIHSSSIKRLLLGCSKIASVI